MDAPSICPPLQTSYRACAGGDGSCRLGLLKHLSQSLVILNHDQQSASCTAALVTEISRHTREIGLSTEPIVWPSPSWSYGHCHHFSYQRHPIAIQTKISTPKPSESIEALPAASSEVLLKQARCPHVRNFQASPSQTFHLP